jgi:hypothetical protein
MRNSIDLLTNIWPIAGAGHLFYRYDKANGMVEAQFNVHGVGSCVFSMVPSRWRILDVKAQNELTLMTVWQGLC